MFLFMLGWTLNNRWCLCHCMCGSGKALIQILHLDMCMSRWAY